MSSPMFRVTPPPAVSELIAPGLMEEAGVTSAELRVNPAAAFADQFRESSRLKFPEMRSDSDPSRIPEPPVDRKSVV